MTETRSQSLPATLLPPGPGDAPATITADGKPARAAGRARGRQHRPKPFKGGLAFSARLWAVKVDGIAALHA